MGGFCSALISWKVTGTSPYFLVPKFPDFYSKVVMQVVAEEC